MRHRSTDQMPTDPCAYFFDCKDCGAVLRPNAGDCCVYCSFGDVPCPPIQEARASGAAASCCGQPDNHKTAGRRMMNDQGRAPWLR